MTDVHEAMNEWKAGHALLSTSALLETKWEIFNTHVLGVNHASVNYTLVGDKIKVFS